VPWSNASYAPTPVSSPAVPISSVPNWINDPYSWQNVVTPTLSSAPTPVSSMPVSSYTVPDGTTFAQAFDPFGDPYVAAYPPVASTGVQSSYLDYAPSMYDPF